jgi:hypothetical protein
MADVDPIFVVEEQSIELVKKRGLSPWLILGAIGVVIWFVLGLRRASAKRRRSRPAVPTTDLPT